MTTDLDQQTQRLEQYVTFEQAGLHGNIALCDQKAGILLAFSAAMVVYCLQGSVSALASTADRSSAITVAVRILYLASALGFFSAAFFALRVVWPRIHRATEDHVYWDSKIFQLSESRFIETLNAMPDGKLADSMQRHLHRLAGICRRKFADLNRAIWFGATAFFGLVITEGLQALA